MFCKMKMILMFVVFEFESLVNAFSIDDFETERQKQYCHFGGTQTNCYRCINGKDVLSSERICDGKFDCCDLSDEFLCPERRVHYESTFQYAVANFGMMGIDSEDSAVDMVHRMCIPNCTVPTASSYLQACRFCAPGMIQCPSKVEPGEHCDCVSKEQVCDGVFDCANGEDESFCGPNLIEQIKEASNESATVNSEDISDPLSSIDSTIEYLAKSKIRCDKINRGIRLSQMLSQLHPWQPRPFNITVGHRNSYPYSRYFDRWNSNFSPSEEEVTIRTKRSFNRSISNFIFSDMDVESMPIHKLLMTLMKYGLNVTANIIIGPHETVLDGVDTVAMKMLCDGTVHCENSADELLCPDKFYCKNKQPLYVDKMKVMDGINDCGDGSDEKVFVGGHTLVSRYNLINNWTLQVLVWVMAITALIGNMVVMGSTLVQLVRHNQFATARDILNRKQVSVKDAITGGMVRTLSGISVSSFSRGSRRLRLSGGIGGRRRLVKTWNAVLVLNLATSDFLTGVYLIWLAIVSALYEGESNTHSQYWIFDREWRTGPTCAILGSILVTSSQTSVFTLVALTTVRLYTVLKPFSTYHLKFRYLVAVCLSTWFISLLISLAPMMPSVKDSFISAAWVPFPQFHPPVINRTMADTLIRGISYITNTSIVEGERMPPDLLCWDSMVNYLKRVAPDYSDWKFYGYYSEDPVCMPKLFIDPFSDRFWIHAVSILSINFVSIVYIASAYALIYYKSAVQENNNQRKVHRRSISINKTSSLPGSQEHGHPRRGSVITRCEEPSKCSQVHRMAPSKRLRRSKSSDSLRRDKFRKARSIANEMQRRITLLVITDCLCWAPICIMGFISACGIQIPDIAYAITAIGLIPINSALNPLLYSRFMRTLWSRGWSSLRTKVSSSIISNASTSDVITYNNGCARDLKEKKISSISSVVIDEKEEVSQDDYATKIGPEHESKP